MKYSWYSSLQHLTYLKLQNTAKEMGGKEETKKFANSIQVEITKKIGILNLSGWIPIGERSIKEIIL